MVAGQFGDPGAHAPEVVVEDHRDEQELVPVPRQEMVVPTAKEETFKSGNVTPIDVQVRLLHWVICWYLRVSK